MAPPEAPKPPKLSGVAQNAKTLVAALLLPKNGLNSDDDSDFARYRTGDLVGGTIHIM